jgi:hypothetical protein
VLVLFRKYSRAAMPSKDADTTSLGEDARDDPVHESACAGRSNTVLDLAFLSTASVSPNAAATLPSSRKQQSSSSSPNASSAKDGASGSMALSTGRGDEGDCSLRPQEWARFVVLFIDAVFEAATGAFARVFASSRGTTPS